MIADTAYGSSAIYTPSRLRSAAATPPSGWPSAKIAPPPLNARIDGWLTHQRARASAKSPLGEALAYIAKYRGLQTFVMNEGPPGAGHPKSPKA